MPRSVGEVVTALTVFVVFIGGYVALMLTGHDTNGLVGVVSPILAGLFVTNVMTKRANKTDRVLSRVHANTNGLLDDRIRQGVREVLDERGMTGGTP